MNSGYIIPPRLTLPMKPMKSPPVLEEPPPKKVPKRNLAFVIGLEALYLVAAGEVGSLVYFYLAPWPIYRIVAFVALFILWSNFASALARNKTTKEQTVELFSTMRPKKQEVSSDTTAYLVALRKTFKKD